jgi:hypothetical protein
MSSLDTTEMATQPTAAAGTHSCVIAPHLKDDLATSAIGKYGRMFPDLPCNECDEALFALLARAGAPMDLVDAPATDETPAQTAEALIPAGYPVFGQFIAHNITADRSMIQHHANLGELRNFRTPSLNLESLYSAGPSGSPYLYDANDSDKFLLGVNDAGNPYDLPRNAQGVALLGDPRDDVHLLISQLHMVFLTFHNAIVDHLRAEGVPASAIFSEAQRLTRWHYQWIVVHEFLPLLVGQEVLAAALANRAYYHFDAQPFIPIEFSDAAYRTGHSQIRTRYHINDAVEGPVFPDLAGGRPVPQRNVIDWRNFFELDAARPPQQSKRIEPKLAHALIELPAFVVGAVAAPEYASLAYRDLQRARSLDMPSGEAVARIMGIEPLSVAEVGLDALGWNGDTPLWYYVLREAEIRFDGARMGPVGGRIVAEVLLGLLDGDPTSYRTVQPDWQPTLPAGQPGTFTIADLLRFAGAAGAR